MWRGAVSSAIRGKRGQKFFIDLLAGLDELPEKKLIQNELVTEDGCFCALGALGRKRGCDMKDIDPDDIETCADTFDIAEALAREVVWENDEAGVYNETPEQRFVRVREWVVSNIKGG